MGKRLFYQCLEKEDYNAAVNALFSLIDEESSLKNYSFAYFRLGELDLSEQGFHSIRLAILSSFTIDSVIPYLYVECCRAKLKPEFHIGGYNLLQQEILNTKSKLYEFKPEVLILAVRLQEISPCFYDSFLDYTKEQIEVEIENVVKRISSLILTFRDRSNATIILHNFETPPRPVFGTMDNQHIPSQKNSIYKINSAIEDIARQTPGLYILDYEGLTSLHGKLTWQDEKMRLLARMPITGKNCVHLANEYMRFLKPLRGLNRKCLIFDLDNTLWGGILGEDGIDGIKLGHTYPGNAFLAFQKEILKLHSKGVILAINSRNNESDVMEVFKQHPDMIIRKKHLASWRINWQDKVQNMSEIAEELNIGLDSIVFVDDSPVEREHMKTCLPEVLTVDMPSDPVQYCSTLRNITDFEILSFSSEDQKRGEMYRAQVERKKLQKSSISLEDFYRGLDMTATINLAEDHSISRISQLTQRTNQFNLTTKRYSESDISYFIKSADYHVFYARLRDRFGDNGIVGVCIVRTTGKTEWEIDTYLLSCRALGRTLETALLAFVVDVARRNGVKSIYGIYISTSKNQPAADFYKLHGFKICEESSNELKWWLDVGRSDIGFPQWIELETNYGS